MNEEEKLLKALKRKVQESGTFGNDDLTLHYTLASGPEVAIWFKGEHIYCRIDRLAGYSRRFNRRKSIPLDTFVKTIIKKILEARE